jgi:hypothetical protein
VSDFTDECWDAKSEVIALRAELEKARERIAELQAEAGYADSIAAVARAQRDSARKLLREANAQLGEICISDDLRARIAKELGQ